MLLNLLTSLDFWHYQLIYISALNLASIVLLFLKGQNRFDIYNTLKITILLIIIFYIYKSTNGILVFLQSLLVIFYSNYILIIHHKVTIVLAAILLIGTGVNFTINKIETEKRLEEIRISEEKSPIRCESGTMYTENGNIDGFYNKCYDKKTGELVSEHFRD